MVFDGHGTYMFFGPKRMCSTEHLLVILKLCFCISCTHEVKIHGTAGLTAANSGSNFTTMFTFLSVEEIDNLESVNSYSNSGTSNNNNNNAINNSKNKEH